MSTSLPENRISTEPVADDNGRSVIPEDDWLDEPVEAKDELDDGLRELLLEESSRQHRSHARVAHLAAARAHRKIIHVTNVGWFQYDGKRWCLDEDDKAASRFVMDVIRELAPDALSDRDLAADLKQSSTASGVAGVLKLMAALPGVTVAVEQLDADPYLLNLANGYVSLRELRDAFGRPVDWRSLTLRPHDPDLLMTHVARARFNPDAQSLTWERFLARSLPDVSVRDYLQRVVGLGLIGEQPEHTLPIMAGEGRNGKGVSYGAVHWALGDYSVIPEPALLEVVKGDPSKPNPAMLALMGARFVWLSETAKTAQIDAALLKRLTGGDPITARGLYAKRAVTFNPSHLLFLITNHQPQLPADDPAVWERVRSVPWNVVIPKEERDSRLNEKLRTQKSADAVLGWALEGLAAYFAEGLNEPEEVAAATAEYAAKQDTVGRFVADACHPDVPENAGDSITTIYDGYRRWCRRAQILNEHVLDQGAFGKRLDALGYVEKRSNGRRFRSGLRVDQGFDSDDFVPVRREPSDVAVDDVLPALVAVGDDSGIIAVESDVSLRDIASRCTCGAGAVVLPDHAEDCLSMTADEWCRRQDEKADWLAADIRRYHEQVAEREAYAAKAAELLAAGRIVELHQLSQQSSLSPFDLPDLPSVEAVILDVDLEADVDEVASA